jgi:predicted nicotinamide N-methyase
VTSASPTLRASLQEQLTRLGDAEPLPELLDAVLERVPVGGTPTLVVRPRDWPRLREAEAEIGRDAPYWAIIWPSGEALADAVSGARLQGSRVLELGCGLALPSVAAARGGASVLASDGSTDAVAYAAHTLALNDVEGEVLAVDWREPDALVEAGPFDLVLASDVLYLRTNVDRLVRLLPRLLAPGGEAWIADPGRTGAQEFLAAARSLFHLRSVPDQRHERVTIHRLRRRT